MWKELLPQFADHAFSHWYSFMASCANCQNFLNSAFARNFLQSPRLPPPGIHALSTWACGCALACWNPRCFFKTSSRHGARCLPSPPLQLRLAQFAQGFFGWVNMLSTKLVSLHVTSLSVYTAWISLKMIPSLSAGFVAWCAPSSYQHK